MMTTTPRIRQLPLLLCILCAAAASSNAATQAPNIILIMADNK